MTSSINFKKLVSVGAALLLALGGSLGAATPAQAAPSAISNLVLLHTGQTTGQFQADLTAVTGGSFSQASAPAGDKIWWIARPTSAANLSSTDTTDVVDHASPVTGEVNGSTSTTTAPGGSFISGQLINITGLTAGTAYKFYFVLRSTQSDNTTKSYSTVAVAFFTTDAGSQQVSGGTPVSAPATPTISNGVATKGTAGVWTNASQNLSGFWLLCSSAHAARVGGGAASDCGPISATALNGQNATWVSTNPLTITPTFNKWVSCGGGSGCTTAAINTAGMFLVWYEYDGMSNNTSATAAIDGVQVSSVVAPVLSPEQARNQIKPLPVIVQPLVAALPALSKPLVDAGGKIDLKAGDFTGLVSASISGKTIDLTVGSTGSLTITVPNGQAGTTADLLLNFKSGTVILQDAIKYVAPVVVAQVPVRPVSIKAGAKKLSATAADDIRHAAFANLKNNSIECVAYAASAATADAAKATAQQACDLAVKSNPDLVNTSVVVVIDKIKAATQGVGIRVYKQ